MELIREALNKAKTSAGDRQPRSQPVGSALRASNEPVQRWSLQRVVPDATHLARERIVSYAMSDPCHAAFNLLRTKVHTAMRKNNSTTLAIVSPTPGCGKTTVSLNLAFSLARSGCRTALIDLDLKKTSMAKALGLRTAASTSEFLEGKAELQQCFVQIGDNLFVGLNNHSVELSSELLYRERSKDIIEAVKSGVSPDLILFDLPPMLISDDALTFLQRVDSSLLVAGSGMTTVTQIDECQRLASASTNVIGVVLNKVQGELIESYNYAGY